MGTNFEIYLIGLAVLFFLIFVFLFIKKITSNGNLKVKIENITDQSNSENSIEYSENQTTFDFQESKNETQELIILNLISMDRSQFDIDQMFGFLSNYGAKIKNGFFLFYDGKNSEQFRVLNALKPGTFEDETKTFAIVIVSDLMSVKDPLNCVRQMIEFSLDFSEKFHATLCDQERTPITKQMISHIESKAQDIARIKKLQEHQTVNEN